MGLENFRDCSGGHSDQPKIFAMCCYVNLADDILDLENLKIQTVKISLLGFENFKDFSFLSLKFF